MYFYRSKKIDINIVLALTHGGIVWDTHGVDVSVSAASCTECGLVL